MIRLLVLCAGSRVLIDAGRMGDNFEATGAVVDIVSGAIGDAFGALEGSVVTLSGGSIGSNAKSVGSTVNIEGGVVGEGFVVTDASTVNLTDGIVGRLQVQRGSEVNMSGGIINGNLYAFSGSTINLFGTQFILDGIDITDALVRNQPLTILQRNVMLGGRFADGTPVDFNIGGDLKLASDTQLTVTLIPEPSSGYLLLVGISLGLL